MSEPPDRCTTHLARGTATNVTVTDLWRSYSANEVAADEKWEERHLLVVGYLRSVGEPAKSNPIPADQGLFE
jgi:hypothetical protein